MERIHPDRVEEWHMALNEPLPWQAGSGGIRERWSDEDEAATWGAVTGG